MDALLAEAARRGIPHEGDGLPGGRLVGAHADHGGDPGGAGTSERLGGVRSLLGQVALLEVAVGVDPGAHLRLGKSGSPLVTATSPG